MRRTKILATLGPVSARAEVLDAMIAAGLDAVRLNFSHGTPEWHREAVALARAASERAKRPLAVLGDLQGPKIRVGTVKGDRMELPDGSRLTITARKVEGTGGVVSTDYEDLPRDVKKGERILLDDGRIALDVEEVKGEDILCRVVNGGVLSSHKGINVPGAALRAPSLTEKDREDARLALELGMDYLALSFVRRARDVIDLRKWMESLGRSVPVVAKIEKPQAIDNLEEIVLVADGVMVARGDLGVEVSLEMIPAFQKRIIERANRAGKLVITATQMLESMTESPIPTRAEVTDVANAILNGTDVVMLSGETSIGKHPVEAVRRMASIAATTEDTLYSFSRPGGGCGAPAAGDFTPVIACLAGHASREIDPRAIVVFTRSGRTARLLSFERPREPVVAFAVDESVVRRLALHWGIVPRRIAEMGSVAELLAAGERLLIAEGFAGPGDTVIFLLGSSTSPGATNSLKIARMGDVEREMTSARAAGI